MRDVNGHWGLTGDGATANGMLETQMELEGAESGEVAGTMRTGKGSFLGAPDAMRLQRLSPLHPLVAPTAMQPLSSLPCSTVRRPFPNLRLLTDIS